MIEFRGNFGNWCGYKMVCDGINLVKVVMELNIVIVFILIFGVFVFFYELGYLYFVKRVGILCCEFVIGFGLKIFLFEKNEMVYMIWLLFFGGYVRMVGEDVDIVELKFGKKVGFVLNEKDEVVKLVFDGYEKYLNVCVIEVE